MAAISIRNVRHQYRGGRVALGGVSLEIERGLFGLVGPNGAGKTTLMRIVCTLLVPTAGQVTVDGHDVVGHRGAVRRVLGFLPQEFGAWRVQRVAEVLDTLALLAGVHHRTLRRRRVADMLDLVGLTDVATRKVKALSGGMLRRLGLAQAMLHDPPVLVVDEPTSGLDPAERLRFRQLMAKLSEERTIVLSTHIIADLALGCRDLAVLDRGQVIFRGHPQTLVDAARGSVFEWHATGAPAAATGAVLSRALMDDDVVVRAIVAPAGAPSGARPVDTPSLEEAYLALMARHAPEDFAQELSS